MQNVSSRTNRSDAGLAARRAVLAAAGAGVRTSRVTTAAVAATEAVAVTAAAAVVMAVAADIAAGEAVEAVTVAVAADNARCTSPSVAHAGGRHVSHLCLVAIAPCTAVTASVGSARAVAAAAGREWCRL